MDELLPAVVLKNIGDKLYDKRKAAALEVEQIIKRLTASNDQYRIKVVIDKLAAEYANSNQANNRKGALLCLAAATVGLGNPTTKQLETIVPSVLRSFTDQDPRVRYYACEALYNIAKVSRTAFLPYFNEVFDAMFRLCADSDTNVMNAVQFLDNLIKDIVVASPTQFNITAFIPKLRDYLPVMSPAKRTFLISWIQVLDSIPDLDMLAHLPALLGGLMSMLADPNREIRIQAHKALLEFLVEIQATPGPHVDFAALAATQVEFAANTDEYTRLTAIKWLKELVQLSSVKLMAQYPAILGVVLLNISHSSKEISEVARQASDVLLACAPEDQSDCGSGGSMGLCLDTRSILSTISKQLIGPGGGGAGHYQAAAHAGEKHTGGGAGWGGPGEASRLEALRWVELLLSRSHAQVLDALPALLPALLDALTSQSEAVSDGALGVFAAIARCPGQFQPMLAALLDRFRGPHGVKLLQHGGAAVIRRLCAVLGPEPVFVELARLLSQETDLAFASTMVQALNLILLTSPEVSSLRETLKGAGVKGGVAVAAVPGITRGPALFYALHRCWSHSVGALLCLCFLAQAYDHACSIVHCFRWLPMGAEVLIQLDRLVQLLDAPAFTPLRLSLLQPRLCGDLMRTLHGLLMLLPQSNAFRALSTRLQAVPLQALIQLEDQGTAACVAAASAATAASTSSPAPLTTPPAPHHGHRHQHALSCNLPHLQWSDIDLASLLKAFCVVQRQHYALETGEVVSNPVPVPYVDDMPWPSTEPDLSASGALLYDDASQPSSARMSIMSATPQPSDSLAASASQTSASIKHADMTPTEPQPIRPSNPGGPVTLATATTDTLRTSSLPPQPFQRQGEEAGAGGVSWEAGQRAPSARHRTGMSFSSVYSDGAATGLGDVGAGSGVAGSDAGGGGAGEGPGIATRSSYLSQDLTPTPPRSSTPVPQLPDAPVDDDE